jgi:hypothetical protein
VYCLESVDPLEGFRVTGRTATSVWTQLHLAVRKLDLKTLPYDEKWKEPLVSEVNIMRERERERERKRDR